MEEELIESLLMEAIDAMDYKHKSILTGYYYNQLSIPELAKINNTDSRNIYRMLSYARQILREYLKNNGLQESDCPQPLSLATDLFLSYGENAIEGKNNEQ